MVRDTALGMLAVKEDGLEIMTCQKILILVAESLQFMLMDMNKQSLSDKKYDSKKKKEE